MAKRKKLTAKKVKDFLNELENNGVDLSKVTINFRYNRDSDVVSGIEEVEEDLFDNVTNNILESIVFIKDSRKL